MSKNETSIEKERHLRLVQALLENPSLETACKAAGCARSTGYRYMNDPDFQRLLVSTRSRLLSHAVARLAAAGAEAVETLRGAMKDTSAPPSARVAAARAVLEMLARFAGIGADDAPGDHALTVVFHTAPVPEDAPEVDHV